MCVADVVSLRRQCAQREKKRAVAVVVVATAAIFDAGVAVVVWQGLTDGEDS